MAGRRRNADIGGYDLSPESAAGDDFDESSDDGGLISSAPAVELVDRYGNAGNNQPLENLFTGIDAEAAGEAVDAMNAALATGDNPLSIVNTLAGILGVSQARAETIARTEMLGAWRDAQSINFRANSDVLDGWIWSADLAGACIACVMMDGTVHTLDEDLDSHPNCECCQLPLTKSWDDILGDIEGFDMDLLHAVGPETDYLNEGNIAGEDWFLRQPESYQLEVLGPAKFEAWAAGDVELLDFVGQKDAGAWGNEIYERSLKEIGLDANAYLGRTTLEEFTSAAEEAAVTTEETATETAAEIADTVGGRAADAFIHPDDVAAWTADNADGVPSIAYHAGSAEKIAGLQANGIDVEAAFGERAGIRGFYMLEQPPTGEFADIYGEHSVAVAVHMTNPLELDAKSYKQLIEDTIAAIPNGEARRYIADEEFQDEFSATLREIVRSRGYDGIIRDTGYSGVEALDREIIAIEPGTVRVITDEAARTTLADVTEDFALRESAALTREALADKSMAELRQMARDLGVTPARSKVETVDRILAKTQQAEKAAQRAATAQMQIVRAAARVAKAQARYDEIVADVQVHLQHGHMASGFYRNKELQAATRELRTAQTRLANLRKAAEANGMAVREGEVAAGAQAAQDALAARLDRLPVDATVADMQDWLKEQLPGIERVDLMGLDAQTARLVANASANLIQALPEVADNIWRIAATNTYSDALAMVPRDGLSILLNTDKWTDLAGLAERSARYAADGWWVGERPEEIIGHEIGHALQLNYKISNDTWVEAMERVAAAGGNPLVSTYAGDKIEESFAETFALLVYGEPTDAQLPIVREMADLLRDHGIDYNTLRAAVGESPLDLGAI